jgi:hypothetical protein
LEDEFDDGADWLNGDHDLPDGTKQALQGLHLHPSKRLQLKVCPGYYLSNPSE